VSKTYNATITANLLVSAECESCGNDISWLTPIKQTGSGSYAQLAQQNAINNLNNRIKNINQNQNYGYQKCTNCSYVQSWMMPSITAAMYRRMKWVGYGLVAVFAAGALFGGLTMVDSISSALGTTWQTSTLVVTVVALALPLVLAVGIQQYMKRQYANADTDTNVVIKEHKPVVGFGVDRASTYASVGLIYTDQNDLKKAQDYFAQALRINSREAMAIGGRGVLKFKQGDIAGAIADLNQHKSIAGKFANLKMLALLKTLEDAIRRAAAEAESKATPPSDSPDSTDS
jgi:tetratricopeptide (TPR) repeat protein